MVGIEYLYQYMFNKEIFLQNDIVQLANNVVYRDANYLDHLEMILARHKLDVSEEVFADIRWIIRTYCTTKRS